MLSYYDSVVSRQVNSHCISICGNNSSGKICSKTVLVEIRRREESTTIKCLAIIDEQSDSSFCDPKLFNYLNVEPIKQSYSLSTMNGLSTNIEGCYANGLQIKGVTEDTWIDLPSVLANPHIPNTKSQIASSKIVYAHPHIRHLAKNFPEINDRHDVLILVGADCGPAMKTESFGSKHPYVHKTALGWTLVGPICRESKENKPSNKMALRTSVSYCNHFSSKPSFDSNHSQNEFSHKSDSFYENSDNDTLDLSRNDRKFVEIVTNGISINSEGHLEIPLPFKDNINLPFNKIAVYQRTKNTLERLKRDSTKLKLCNEIMAKYLESGHVEQVPPDEKINTKYTNYIPVFPVSHKKKDKPRIVFDGSAEYSGKSLNENLLQGPDENNKIIGVLTRFRHGEVGFVADIECMFHQFYVPPEQRDFLRFFWWSENDPTKPLTTFRAKVHVFGNRCSPAIATFGLRYTATTDKAKEFPEASKLINENMYVDDALGSADSVEEATKILKDSMTILDDYGINLHKIVSNKPQLMSNFPVSKLAAQKELIDISHSDQKTLGICWRTSSDEFVFKCEFPNRPLTKRGCLSTVNSLFDPLGMVCPVVLGGKLLQREICPKKTNRKNELVKLGWDEPLPDTFISKWQHWLEALSNSVEIKIARNFSTPNFGPIKHRMLIALSDASENAIGYVIYLRLISESGDIQVSFVYGGSRVSPRSAVTIPRLELCAALESTRAICYISKELNCHMDSVMLYTDSRVVLGYLNNADRRFSKYVSNRVGCILKVTSPEQWNYVSTTDNTADIASRAQTPQSLINSNWFKGPDFLWKKIDLQSGT